MFFFLKIVLVHILGDFVLQPQTWVKAKEDKKIKAPQLYYHIGIHALLLLLILQFNLKDYWLGVLTIIFSHYSIDLLKIYFQKKNTKRTWFIIDQFLHISILIMVANFYHSFAIPIYTIFNSQNVLFVISLLGITHISSVIIKLIITQWNPENKEDNDDSLAKAGRYIGILERLFVFIFVITNHWEAIGFLLAAKSVFRFGDLTSSKDRKLTEYILIGTLLSFGFAIVIGVLYLYATQFV